MDGDSAWRDVTREVFGPEKPRLTCLEVAGAVVLAGCDNGTVLLRRIKLAAAAAKQGHAGAVLVSAELHRLAPPARSLPHAAVTSVALSPSQRRLAIGTADGFVNILDLPRTRGAPPNGIFSQRLHPGGAVTQLVWGAWSRRVFSACDAGLLQVTLLADPGGFSLFQGARTARVLLHPSPVVQLAAGVLCGYTHPGLEGEIEVQAVLATFAEPLPGAAGAASRTGKERRLYYFLPPGSSKDGDVTPLTAASVENEGLRADEEALLAETPRTPGARASGPRPRYLRLGGCFVCQGHRVGIDLLEADLVPTQAPTTFLPSAEVEGAYCVRPGGLVWKVSGPTGDILAALRPATGKSPRAGADGDAEGDAEGDEEGSVVLLRAMASMMGERQPQLMGYDPGRPGVTLMDPRTLRRVTLAADRPPVVAAAPVSFPGIAGGVFCVHQPETTVGARERPFPILGLLAPAIVLQAVAPADAPDFAMLPPAPLRGPAASSGSTDQDSTSADGEGDGYPGPPPSAPSGAPWERRAEHLEWSLRGLQRKAVTEVPMRPTSAPSEADAAAAAAATLSRNGPEPVSLPRPTGDVVADVDALLQVQLGEDNDAPEIVGRVRSPVREDATLTRFAALLRESDDLVTETESKLDASLTALRRAREPTRAEARRRRRARVRSARQIGTWGTRWSEARTQPRDIPELAEGPPAKDGNTYEECLAMKEGQSLGLGLGIVGNKVLVKGLNPLENGEASPAQASLRISVGDLLVGVNALDFDKMVFFEIVDVLQNLPRLAATGAIRFRFRIADAPAPRGAFDAADVGHDRPWRPPLNTALSTQGPNAPSRVSVGVGVGMEVGAEVASLALESGSRIFGKFQSLGGGQRTDQGKMRDVTGFQSYSTVESDDDVEEVANPLEEMFQEMIATPLRQAHAPPARDPFRDDFDAAFAADAEAVPRRAGSPEDDEPLPSISPYLAATSHGEASVAGTHKGRVFVFGPTASGFTYEGLAALLLRGAPRVDASNRVSTTLLRNATGSVEVGEQKAPRAAHPSPEALGGPASSDLGPAADAGFRWGCRGTRAGHPGTHAALHPDMGFDLSDALIADRLLAVAADVRRLAAAGTVVQESFFFWQRRFPKGLRPMLGRGQVPGIYLRSRAAASYDGTAMPDAPDLALLPHDAFDPERSLPVAKLRLLLTQRAIAVPWLGATLIPAFRLAQEPAARLGDEEDAWWVRGIQIGASDSDVDDAASSAAASSPGAYHVFHVNTAGHTVATAKRRLGDTSDDDSEADLAPEITTAPHRQFLAAMDAVEAGFGSAGRRGGKLLKLGRTETEVLRQVAMEAPRSESLDVRVDVVSAALGAYADKKLAPHLLSYNQVFPNRSPRQGPGSRGRPVWLQQFGEGRVRRAGSPLAAPASPGTTGSLLSRGIALGWSFGGDGGDGGPGGASWSRVGNLLPPAGLTYLASLVLLRLSEDFVNPEAALEMLVAWLRSFSPVPFVQRHRLDGAGNEEAPLVGFLEDADLMRSYLRTETVQRPYHRALTRDLVSAYFVLSTCGSDVDVQLRGDGGGIKAHVAALDGALNPDPAGSRSLRGGGEPWLWEEFQALAFVREYGVYMRLPLVVRICSLRQWRRAQDEVLSMVEQVIRQT